MNQRKISFNVVSKEEEFKNKIETTIKWIINDLKVKDLKNLMLDYKIVKENIKKRFVPQFMMSASMWFPFKL